MAQDSFPWGCTPSVGDAGAVTVNDLVNANQFTGNTQPNEEGVVYWTSTNPLPGGSVAVDGLLEPSLAGSVVSIDTGIGMVQGWNFVNDAVVDFNFAADAGNANATDLIVLERGNPATELTVRLARVKGAASTVATVTQSETLWQVAIAQVPLNGSGLPTSVVDVRRFVGQVMSWRQGGSATNWNTAGTTNYLVGNVEMMTGVAAGTVTSGNNSDLLTINFPRAFANVANFIPIVDSSSIIALIAVASAPDVVNFDRYDVVVQTADGTNVGSDTNYRIRWLAIGER